jgi:hypothetical protein
LSLQQQLPPRTPAAAVLNESTGVAIGVVENTTVSTSYHVHKAILAAGPCRSEYLCDSSVTGITLPSPTTTLAALSSMSLPPRRFPTFLDYLYTTTTAEVNNRVEFRIMSPSFFTTNNATALYSLAKYF